MSKHVITIQRWFRGCILRLKRLPTIMYSIQKYIQLQGFNHSLKNADGRINSCFDEDKLIELLITEFGKRIKKSKIRMWYDILVLDYMYGWLPVNIKSTTMKTSDNIGNLSICVYAYTNENLNLHTTKTYKNGEMSIILCNKLKNKDYNYKNKKDYYFIILDKTNNCNVVINSLKGLTELRSNINNLPFQVCWNKNKTFKYNNIRNVISKFVNCIQKSKPSWKEEFITKIKKLEIN